MMNITGNPFADDDIWKLICYFRMKDICEQLDYIECFVYSHCDRFRTLSSVIRGEKYGYKYALELLLNSRLVNHLTNGSNMDVTFLLCCLKNHVHAQYNYNDYRELYSCTCGFYYSKREQKLKWWEKEYRKCMRKKNIGKND